MGQPMDELPQRHRQLMKTAGWKAPRKGTNEHISESEMRTRFPNLNINSPLSSNAALLWVSTF